MRVNWVFWALLVVGLLLLFAPFLGLVRAAVSGIIWLLGALLIIGAIIWAVSTLGRAATSPSV